MLQAARFAFAERGLAASVEEIARRAGVGAGTVHRHFRSKEALFDAVVEERIGLFADTARDLADVEDPGEVFFRFLASVVRLAAGSKALCEALAGVADGGSGARSAAGRDFGEALDALLARAQEAGAVRQDVTGDDVRSLLAGCVSMEQRRLRAAGSEDAQGRMTALMCDGLRAGRAVTKLPDAAGERNETGCEVCGAQVVAARTGRPARFCGGACRQKAYRARRAGSGGGAAGGVRAGA
ncbi:TetR/AcrR family transcriptional regulator [Streptomyces sp. NPDC048644]|uniref:TetR/AcrR family transcriptional regulator n=1 Tax=Streptomyces sp. NPDC048644 TaxID=3365582 RepID=UPI00371F35A1